MSHINICRAHRLSLEQARQSAETIAIQLDEKFQLDYYWKGSTLYFERAGVNGYMDVEPTEIRIHARLGFLLTPFKPRFEQAIHSYMDKLLVENQ
jgi:putative polyhydroxyalkanoate system protein